MRGLAIIDENDLSGSGTANAAAQTGTTARVGSDAEPKAEVVSLLAEELSVAKRAVETGRVRLEVVTRTHEELVDELLTDETADVQHVAIGRPIDAIPPVRHEGDTTIVPVVVEELIVQRRLMLKEEIHIRLVRSARRYQERVALRRQEATVTRTATAASIDPGETGKKAGSAK